MGKQMNSEHPPEPLISGTRQGLPERTPRMAKGLLLWVPCQHLEINFWPQPLSLQNAGVSMAEVAKKPRTLLIPPEATRQSSRHVLATEAQAGGSVQGESGQTQRPVHPPSATCLYGLLAPPPGPAPHSRGFLQPAGKVLRKSEDSVQ